MSSGPMSEEDLVWATRKKQGKAQIKVLRSLGYHPNVVDGKPRMTWEEWHRIERREKQSRIAWEAVT